MNTLAIVTQDPANYGGVLRLVEYIYKRAESIGISPTIVHYARFSEHPELNASSANFLRGELNFRPRDKEYQFKGMRTHAIGAYLPEWEPNRIRANRLWHRGFNNYNGCLLVTGSSHTGLPLVQQKKSFAAWVSSTVEDDRSERLQHTLGITSWLEQLSLPVIRRAEVRVLDNSSRILAVSEDARTHLSVLTKTSLEVWPYPIDTDRFCPDRTDTSSIDLPIRFLFVGRANDPRKRIDLFFRACDILQAMLKGHEFSAVIVSNALPHTAPFSFRLEHHKSVSDGELIALYKSSTALVLTSEQEGLGIAAMEAMACGVPVISTRCGGPATFMIDNTTGFFVSNEPLEVAERMYELATNAELRRKMARASRERIDQHFSESVWNPKFEKLIAEAVN